MKRAYLAPLQRSKESFNLRKHWSLHYNFLNSETHEPCFINCSEIFCNILMANYYIIILSAKIQTEFMTKGNFVSLLCVALECSKAKTTNDRHLNWKLVNLILGKFLSWEIWNPEIQKRKLPKLLFLELFLETFQETKTLFQEKEIFLWDRVVRKCCCCM